MRRAAVLLALSLLVAACGGGDDSPREAKTFLIVVNAPFSQTPFVGQTLERGAELAADAEGVVRTVTGEFYRVRLERMDNALSAAQSVRNVRRAIDRGADAIVTDGTGVDAAWRIARDADVPILITYDGARDLVDPRNRPNVFRIAPTNRGLAFRLAEYVIPKGYRVALLSDDSDYGTAGAETVDQAFSRNPEAVATRDRLPAGVADAAPYIVRARRAQATALLVWGQPTTIAAVLIAARSANWDVPVFTPSSAQDPFVRQQLAAHRDWIAGLTFATGRMTAELGPANFRTFRAAFEKRYGPQLVGVKTRDGRDVVQPPDYAMYSYDAVRLLAAALAAGGEPGARLLEQMHEVTVRGANGDERSFNANNHEGVIDDDAYFARFDLDFTFAPVKDDRLSAALPAVEQTQ